MQSKHATGLKFAAGLAAALATAGFAAGVFAAPIAPQDVQIVDHKIEASLNGTPGNAAEGKKWFKGRKLGNCLACHANADLASEAFHGEIGPPLDGVAGRYSEAEMRAILVNSKAVFGNQTIMPGFYQQDPAARIAGTFAGKTILTAEQVEDVIAYLKTLSE